MHGPNDAVARLRGVLDAIDDDILALVERRIAAARAIGAAKPGGAPLKLRPAREAAVVARLEAAASPAARPAVRPVWRELMAQCVQAQAPMALVLGADDPALRLLAREAFGSAPAVAVAASPADALARAEAGGAVAILPLPLPRLPPALVAFRTLGDGAAAVGRLAAEAPTRRRDWFPGSWRARPAVQMPLYPDAAALAEVEAALAAAEPVVAIAEAAALRAALARAAEGEAMLVQAGDCAESFAAFSPARVAEERALLLALGDCLPGEVVHVARAAGQFAKPRSAALEAGGDGLLPSYRGDAVNGAAACRGARVADPRRLLRAHAQSRATVRLLEGLDAAARIEAPTPPVYVSHEALLLPYEQALTRRDGDGRWWATSAHMVWIGARTRDADGAHVDYASGIANAVGVKCDPMLTPDALSRLLDRLDPANEAGRVTLIGRFGAGEVGRALPPLLRRTRAEGRRVLWACDPMHGNTRVLGGIKTRLVADILAELRDFVVIAGAEGVHAGGIHLEATAAPVTECVGGADGVAPADLSTRYESLCDPRLNRAQALEAAAWTALCLGGGSEARAA
ncbi:MAG: 3-deoxy-7-phosphoheptulonate synthase [Alphaproteobacteria bacterium]|nr:3-deoxy-7-phosphoheptulonate synthase [Alphaproteobacteria bacterium]